MLVSVLEPALNPNLEPELGLGLVLDLQLAALAALALVHPMVLDLLAATNRSELLALNRLPAFAASQPLANHHYHSPD